MEGDFGARHRRSGASVRGIVDGSIPGTAIRVVESDVVRDRIAHVNGGQFCVARQIRHVKDAIYPSIEGEVDNRTEGKRTEQGREQEESSSSNAVILFSPKTRVKPELPA